MTTNVRNILAAVVGVTLVASAALAVATPRAHAITLSEMIEMFIALDVISPDKVDQARALIDSEGAGSTASCTNFTRSLTIGDTGADVMELQKFLNGMGYTVATSGAGAPGMETSYYGPATARAVSAFQEAYASEILAPVGLTMGTGYFGNSTRAQANSLCGAETPSTPTNPSNPSTPSNPRLSGGEASLERFDNTKDFSGEEIDEGSEDAEVYTFAFDVEDADIEVNRIDVRFEMSGTGENDPWRVFDEVSLYYDGDKVDSLFTDSKNDWSNEVGDAYELRFNDVDVVVDEGDTAEFTIAVSVMNVDDDDISSATWNVWIPDNGVRARDAAGLDQYIGDADALTDASDDEDFTIVVLGEDAELRLSDTSSNPDAGTIEVDETSRTTDVAVGVFELEARDGDITLNKLVFAVTTSDDMAEVVNDMAIEIDGESFSNYYIVDSPEKSIADELEAGDFSDGDTYFAVFDLADDDDEYTIDGGDTVTLEFLVDFEDQGGDSANYLNGTTFEVDVTSNEYDEWDVENEAGDYTTGMIKGTFNGEEHTLVATGLYATPVSTNTDTQGNDDEFGTFSIKFDVTAFEDDYYVYKLATSTGATGVKYTFDDGSVATTTATLSSTADQSGDVFIVREGETETFTVSVTAEVTSAQYVSAELTELYYTLNSDGTSSLETYEFSPVEDYRTDTEFVGVAAS